MRTASLLCGVLLALSVMSATNALASGVNFAWNECYGEGTGTCNRDFACASNLGTNNAVGSYVAPAGVDSLSGNEVIIEILTSAAALPAWWGFKNAGTCRTTSLSVNFIANASNAVCVDEFSGAAAGGIGGYTIGYGRNPARARLTLAIATPSPGPVDADVEYFAFNLLINNRKTLGSDACAGCLTPGMLMLSSIKLTQPIGLGDFLLSNSTESGSNLLYWQYGAKYYRCGDFLPTRNTTWGSVKSLYR